MKYKNKRAVIDGMRFDSLKEANRWLYLCELADKGEIQDLQRQVHFELVPKQMHDGKAVRKAEYIADFVYFRDSVRVVEDTKGVKTEVYKLKKKLMFYMYGIWIEES